MPPRINWTIKVGDILTSATILISVAALWISLSKDRDAKLTEGADRVRAAAAQAIAQLDRWQAIQLSLYEQLQPSFVETSEMLFHKYDVVTARDEFWQKVHSQQSKIAAKLLEEQLGTGYRDLLSHFPAARAKYVETYSKLAEIETSVTDSFRSDGQTKIMALSKEQSSTPAILGNALRDVAFFRAEELKNRSESVIQPTRDYFFSIITKPDNEIVQASTAPAGR